MKSRLTLTVDPKVSHRAKDAARQRGLSLSALVEKLLSDAAGPSPADHRVPFSRRWRGKMKLADRGDERARRLKIKFKLTGSDAPVP